MLKLGESQMTAIDRRSMLATIIRTGAVQAFH
jgi:hypothetical protein